MVGSLATHLHILSPDKDKRVAQSEHVEACIRDPDLLSEIVGSGTKVEDHIRSALWLSHGLLIGPALGV
jgi:hypothetical protein